jgi:hypothetical protein
VLYRCLTGAMPYQHPGELPDPTRPLVGLLALGYTPLSLSNNHLSLRHPTPR